MHRVNIFIPKERNRGIERREGNKARPNPTE
jgi:hypothetical protein